MSQREVDVLLGSAISSIEQIEAMIVMIGNLNGGRGTTIAADLRQLASILDNLPLIENDMRTIKKRMRRLLSSDPDKTPRGLAARDLQSSPDSAKTTFQPVESVPGRLHSRVQTRPGVGLGGPPPLPPGKKK